ncbi:hypothetical protein [Clostridium beijerinckii]|nr:hypothetical protein [Clostridium beijerinckii]
MAQKPQISKSTKRPTFDRGEQIKEPVYMAPPNPTKSKPSNK